MSNNILATLQGWDEGFVADCASHRKEFLDRWMTFFTRMGDGWAWLGLAAGVIVIDPKHAPVLILQLAGAIALEVLIYKLLKQRFCRPRPYQICERISCMVRPPDEFSFPSGHTGAAFAALIIAGSAYPGLFVPLFFVVLCIAFSRIYLGAHYPSDVLAGAILGTVCAEFTRWGITLGAIR